MRKRKQERNTIVLPVLVNKKTIYTDFKEKKTFLGILSDKYSFKLRYNKSISSDAIIS